jgi:acyl-[acyl carrier protein]--UDP-N-acetylglucosamine O-acyltransferase
MRRRGVKKSDILGLRKAYESLFFGAGEFRNRLDALASTSADDVQVQAMIDFIRAGKRPLTMAIKRGETDEGA